MAYTLHTVHMRIHVSGMLLAMNDVMRAQNSRQANVFNLMLLYVVRNDEKFSRSYEHKVVPVVAFSRCARTHIYAVSYALIFEMYGTMTNGMNTWFISSRQFFSTLRVAT